MIVRGDLSSAVRDIFQEGRSSSIVGVVVGSALTIGTGSLLSERYARTHTEWNGSKSSIDNKYIPGP